MTTYGCQLNPGNGIISQKLSSALCDVIASQIVESCGHRSITTIFHVNATKQDHTIDPNHLIFERRILEIPGR